MGNLLASLSNSTSALRAFERQLNVIQNNVSNASTPGYAKESVGLEALAFDPSNGSTGGVRAGAAVSGR